MHQPSKSARRRLPRLGNYETAAGTPNEAHAAALVLSGPSGEDIVSPGGDCPGGLHPYRLTSRTAASGGPVQPCTRRRAVAEEREGERHRELRLGAAVLVDRAAQRL